MRVAYRNSFADVLFVNFLHQFMSWVVQAFFIVFAFLIGHTAANGTSCAVAGKCSVVAALTGLVFYLAMWAIQIVFLILYLYSKRHVSDSAERTIELRDDALYAATAGYYQSEIFWRGISKITVAFSYVVIQLTPRSMYIVPARAFGSKADKLVFFESARSRVLQARAGDALTP